MLKHRKMTENLFRPGWAALLLSLNWMVRRPLKSPHVDDAHVVLVLNQFFCNGFFKLKGGEPALISVQPKPVVNANKNDQKSHKHPHSAPHLPHQPGRERNSRWSGENRNRRGKTGWAQPDMATAVQQDGASMLTKNLPTQYLSWINFSAMASSS